MFKNLRKLIIICFLILATIGVVYFQSNHSSNSSKTDSTQVVHKNDNLPLASTKINIKGQVYVKNIVSTTGINKENKLVQSFLSHIQNINNYHYNVEASRQGESSAQINPRQAIVNTITFTKKNNLYNSHVKAILKKPLIIKNIDVSKTNNSNTDQSTKAENDAINNYLNSIKNLADYKVSTKPSLGYNSLGFDVNDTLILTRK